jgi:hypothetical protein
MKNVLLNPVVRKLLFSNAILVFCSGLVWPSCVSAVGDSSLEQGSCIIDDECNSGDLCVLGVCIDPLDQDLSLVHLEIRPPENAGLLTQQTFFVETGLPERIALQLRESSSQPGSIRRADGSGLDARLVALPETSIEGRSLVQSVDVGIDGIFSMPLLDSETYRVEVYPNDMSVPPYFLPESIVVQPDSETPQDLGILLSAPEERIAIQGTVVAGEGAAKMPIADLEIHVMHADRRVSSMDYSDDEGYFLVTLPFADYDALSLVIRPSDANPSFPHVKHLLGSVSGDQDLGDISLGTITTPVGFGGVVLGPDREPVAQANIFIRGDVGIGEIKRLLTTDEEGLFWDSIAPGQYDVTVLAPVNSTSAGLLKQSDLDILSTTESIEFMLPPRTAISGEIVNSVGDPVQNASMRLERIGPPGESEDVVAGEAVWSFYANTDLAGAFTSTVDTGRYRVHLEPDPNSLDPLFSTLIDVFAETSPILLQLPAEARFAGRIEMPRSGDPVADAHIRVFSSFSNELGEAILLGEGVSDGQGNFGVILPDLGFE